MFGQKDNQTKDDAALQPSDDNSKPNEGANGAAEQQGGGFPPAETGANSGKSSWQHPGKPLDDQGPMNDVVPSSSNFPKPDDVQASDHPAEDHQPDNTTDTKDGELVAIKHQAVEALSPLVDKLDQSAEERFRTLMMMVQATDNQSLLPKAYEAAKKIDNEEARAQALLDVINEVNYFTHPQNGNN